MQSKLGKRLTVMLSFVLAMLMFAATPMAHEHGFSDVDDDYTHAEAIRALAEEGILQGYPDGSFGIQDNMERQQVAIVLYRALGLDVPEDLDSTLERYSDVSANHPRAKEIAAVTHAGIFEGGNAGAFYPYNTITREQTASVLVRAFELPENVHGGDVEIYLDNVSDAHVQDVQTFANLGLTDRFDDYLPQNPVIRAEYASFTYRTMALDRVSVLHTNDLHGRVDQYPQMITTVNEARMTRPDSLLLDAGDIFSGTLYFNEFRGQAALHFMNMMDYDAFVFGNHEFDLGDSEAEFAHEDLANFVRGANFPSLGANMDFSAHPEFDDLTTNKDGITYEAEGGMIYDGIVTEIDGEEVGIFGINTEDTVDISSTVDVQFEDFAEASERMVSLFEADGVNKIIALTHLGFESDPSVGNDMRLAQEVEGIDIIVGGHSHDYLNEPVMVTEDADGNEIEPTVIVQAGEYGRAVGTLDVVFDDEGVIHAWKGELLDVNEREADPQAAEELIPFTEAVEELANTPAGFSVNEQLPNPRLGGDSEVSVRANETALGNLIADAYLRAGQNAYPETAIAFQNGGGIRAPLPETAEGDGPYEITVGDMITVQPFGNRLTVMDLTGEEIMEVLETSVKDFPGENGGFMQVAGMTFKFDSGQDAGERVHSVMVHEDGEYAPLDMDRTYKVATNNFTAAGGDGYDVLAQAWEETRYSIVGQTDWEILRDHALALVDEVGEVAPTIEGRITEGPAEEVDVPSIMDARDNEIGTEDVTLRGTVTAYFEQGGQTNMYVQDDSAAILVRGSGLGSMYNIGDMVEFTGEINHFRDMIQLLVDDSSLVEANHGMIEPEIVDSSFFEGDLDDVQGKLIEIQDVEVLDNPQHDDFNARDAEGDFIVLGSHSSVSENTDYDAIVGVVNYHFFDNKLMPRNDDDLIEDATVTQPARANVESGDVASGTEVVLSSATRDAEIYYTLDGSDPDENSTLYTEPIVIDEEVTLKTIAISDGLGDSVIREYQYGILPEAGELEIYDIQGAQHVSPYVDQVVRSVPGIVTHTENSGFYFQSEESDGDVNTSEGIYVYRPGHSVSEGDLVEVDGTVVEYEENGFDGNNDLTTTQISATSVSVVSEGNDLPDPVVIGIDREIPSVPVADFGNYDPENPDHFDATVNAIDFFESLEGMLVEVPGQVTVTGPQKYNELTVISEEWDLDNRTDAGGVYLEQTDLGDFAPEMVTEVLFVNVPGGTTAKTGDFFEEEITGVVGYNFGNFKIEPIDGGLPELQDGGLERRDETTIEMDEDKMSVATYNVENFSPESDAEKTARLAYSMAVELNAPDVITLVEVMDNYDTRVGPDTSASESYQVLIDAIYDEVGVEYAYAEVAPEQGQDGGIPGGNIRNGHLYRVDRVELADSSVGTFEDALEVQEDGSLNFGTGLIDPQNDAFRNSRKPVVSEFIFKGEPVFVIGNHWNSKRGDMAPYGMEQPAEQGSRVQRMEIAEVIGDFVGDLNEAHGDDGANVVVVGDFNDYPWSPPVTEMAERGDLHNAIFELPRNAQYTYNYNGYSQSLDSILVTGSLTAELEVDSMNINSDFMEVHGRASDHDPMMVQFSVPDIDPDYEIVPGPSISFDDADLNDNRRIELTVGDDFDYPAVSAEDHEGTDLEVTRSGDDVDVDQPGVYTVVYTAEDANGKTATLRLTVEVIADFDRDDMSVAEAITYNSGEATVRGYIVGSINGSPVLSADGNHSGTNILIADSADETERSNMLPVQLPQNQVRTDLNLQDNIDLLGVEVMVTGSLSAYFSQPGMRDTSDYTITGDVPEEPETDYDEMSIADFRDLNEGESGKIEGIVTTVPGSWGGDRFAIQDETGGIYVDIESHDFEMGDRVSISGDLDIFNDELQVDAKASELIEADQEVPAPRVELMSDVTKSDEGQILTFENVEITEYDVVNNFGTFEFTAVSGDDSFLIRVDNRTGVEADNFDFEEGDIIDVTGLVAEFRGTLQLKPRFADDFAAAE
ncbi:5'-nucleotidase C-terminal domain-containing protein [Salisediminibacterium selenitireducens]|uniref:5'-Nucleotidase domain protein n=1 Tax=Bacillus selenitireducens (strain ATCC 700615 / DSM 15326 / MLS10) TaxID=439292 RepID=D6Y0C1_BACIE|nr:5'-nucleotidase C-terminal domain-containing protein [Salisediminibacterium selenitireducens]ADH98512.1 5'-Nucleotidase domain protein [[Bacillus] selenitireducens MLS10]